MSGHRHRIRRLADKLSPRGRRRLTQVAVAILLLLTLGQTIALALLLRAGGATPPPATAGSLMVTSDPPGATVLVDDVPAGVTPMTTSVETGTHQIALQHAGGVSTHTVTVAGGTSASLHLELEAPGANAQTPAESGNLQITTEPAGANVVVDGRGRGVAPILLTGLAAGRHSVTVSHAGSTLSRSVTIQPGTLSTLVIDLNSEHTSGWIAVSSAIPVQLYESGTLLGNSETPRIMLRAGRHVLDLTNPELRFTTRRSVNVRAGETTPLALEVPNGTVAINALPWAEVWLGDRSLGETPLANVSLPLGTHQLLFKHPTLGEQRTTVVVSMGSPVRVGIDLRKGAR